MSISLQKGQKVNLSKENAGLTRVVVGLGWDEVKKGGFLGSLFGGGADIDCDASAIMLQNGKFVAKEDLVFFGNFVFLGNFVGVFIFVRNFVCIFFFFFNHTRSFLLFNSFITQSCNLFSIA